MAPRTEEQNEAIREESRARILESALALFAAHGYERTTIRMIAEAAGISQGLMYNYFSSKEQLIIALFQRSMQDVRESFAHAEDEHDPRPQIERLIRASFMILRRNMHFWRLSYGVRMQPAVVAGLGDQLHLWIDSIRSTIEVYFQNSGAADPGIEAAILFALIDGISQHYVLDPEHYPLEVIENAVVARYLQSQEKRP